MSLGEPGERLRSGWCNLYQQGWYHRAGKPGTMTLHPGDLYPTREDALADIDHDAPYVGTAFVQWEHPEHKPPVQVFPDVSTPVPLAISRKWSPRTRDFELWSLSGASGADVLIGQSNPEAEEAKNELWDSRQLGASAEHAKVYTSDIGLSDLVPGQAVFREPS